MEFEPVIGLEVHAQLMTRSKLFCSCSTEFNAPVNSNVCPVCSAHPGTLPVLNAKAVEFAKKLKQPKELFVTLAIQDELERYHLPFVVSLAEKKRKIA